MPGEKKVYFANYGHPYPVLYRNNGQAVFLKEKHNRMISPAVPFEQPKSFCFSYEEGDKFFIYSDGLIEQDKSRLDKFHGFLKEFEELSKKKIGRGLMNRLIKSKIKSSPGIPNLKGQDPGRDRRAGV